MSIFACITHSKSIKTFPVVGRTLFKICDKLDVKFNDLVFKLTAKQRANEAIDLFLGTDIPESRRKELLPKMVYLERIFGYTGSEFFQYGLENLPKGQRSDYISEREHFEFCKTINDTSCHLIFEDKHLTYEHFKKFFKREVLHLDTSKDSLPQFVDFVSKHPQFIIKPCRGSLGEGVQVIDMAAEPSAEDLFKRLIKNYHGDFIVEELMKCCKEIAALHPKSVNTVRIPTLNYGDHIDIIHPQLRIGQGDSVVDNAGQGGVMCLLDPQTGVVIAAADKKGHRYEGKSINGIPIIGFQVPRFDECCAFARELATVVPQNRFTGWDLALTDDRGWVMIEGNSLPQFGFQLTSQKGFRQEARAILKAFGH